MPGYEHASWLGVLAPARTPEAIVTRLYDETVRIVRLTEMKDVLLKDGLEPVGDSPKEFAAVIKAKIAKWRKVVKATGIRAN